MSIFAVSDVISQRQWRIVNSTSMEQQLLQRQGLKMLSENEQHQAAVTSTVHHSSEVE